MHLWFEVEMEDANSRGQCQLVEQVIKKGICVKCGACVNLCPYFDYFDGKVVVTDDCHADTWRCLQLCPRAEYGDTSLDNRFGPETGGSEIGPAKKVLMARARDTQIREKAQYGGSVSALLISAMDGGFIRSAILTDRGNEISPTGMIARSKSDILDCAGSRYTASAGLAAFNMAIKEGEEKLAVVGLPCQMEALARMKRMKPDGEERESRIALRIGLFCTWALDYRELDRYLKRMGIVESVKKYDIPPPPSQIFQIQTEKGWQEFPLEEIRPFIQQGCTFCQDMTAEWADISMGTVENMEAWNTVVVRSDTGSAVLSEGREKGLLETVALPEENLRHLKEASLNKRKRGRVAQEELRRKGS